MFSFFRKKPAKTPAPTADQTPEQAFWAWFEANEAMLFDFERDRDTAFAALTAALAKFGGDLPFEFGPKEDGRRELVISAGGIRSRLPTVETLMAAAPRLARWRFTAFRPRRDTVMTVEFHGLNVQPQDVEFAFLTGGQYIGLALFFHGYTEERKDEFGQVGFLMLDSALGEYDVVTKVGAIRFLAFEEAPEANRFPITELARHFDARYAERLQ